MISIRTKIKLNCLYVRSKFSKADNVWHTWIVDIGSICLKLPIGFVNQLKQSIDGTDSPGILYINDVGIGSTNLKKCGEVHLNLCKFLKGI